MSDYKRVIDVEELAELRRQLEHAHQNEAMPCGHARRFNRRGKFEDDGTPALDWCYECRRIEDLGHELARLRQIEKALIEAADIIGWPVGARVKVLQEDYERAKEEIADLELVGSHIVAAVVRNGDQAIELSEQLGEVEEVDKQLETLRSTLELLANDIDNDPDCASWSDALRDTWRNSLP